MGISLPDDTGSAFWIDLRLIRQSLGIPLEQVHRETKVPLPVLSELETSGLSQSPRFNAVYLRSIVRAYCTAIGVTEIDGITALEQARAGQYQGILARLYLGFEPPTAGKNDTLTDPVINETAVEAIIGAEVDVSDLGSDTEAEERVSRSLRKDLVWPMGIAVAVLILVSAIWLITTREGKVEQQISSEPAVVVSDFDTTNGTTEETIARIVPESVLGDSLHVLVVASTGKLEPIRVQIDSGEVVPRWVEHGDSIGFSAASEIALQSWIDRATIHVGGEAWPMETRDSRGRIVITRNLALAFIDSVKNRGD